MKEHGDTNIAFRKNNNKEYDRAIEELLQRQIKSIEVLFEES